MTPKEKAQELFFKYTSELDFALDYDICIIYAKKCSLIVVDELIESFDSIYDASIKNIEKYNGAKFGMKDYWKQVKNEIEKL